jgi:hypothetical protein
MSHFNTPSLGSSITLAAALAAASAGPVVGQVPDFVMYLYEGKIEWTDYVKGPAGFSRETVVALVTLPSTRQLRVRGVTDTLLKPEVACHVHYQSDDQDVSIDGPGLLEIKFGRNKASTAASTYQFTVACPNAMDDPPEEARWSHSMDSYVQQGWKVWDALAKQELVPVTLKGTWTVPNPATDPLNGVTGTLSLTWLLCATPATFQSRVRPCP